MFIPNQSWVSPLTDSVWTPLISLERLSNFNHSLSTVPGSVKSCVFLIHYNKLFSQIQPGFSLICWAPQNAVATLMMSWCMYPTPSFIERPFFLGYVRILEGMCLWGRKWRIWSPLVNPYRTSAPQVDLSTHKRKQGWWWTAFWVLDSGPHCLFTLSCTSEKNNLITYNQVSCFWATWHLKILKDM